MKRLMVGLILAATAFAPIAAGAQIREQAMQEPADADRSARPEPRAERRERRAARAEGGAAVRTPAPDGDRPRRDRVDVARPDSDRASRLERPDRPRRAAEPGLARRERRGQRLIRPEDSADFADYATDPRNQRRGRSENRYDRRDDRFRNDNRSGNFGGFGNGGFDGRGADLYHGGQVWNRGWRNDTRYDWNGYRDRNRNAYRLPRYYAPQGMGYGYRRFGIGFQLTRSLFARDYWLDDPYAYRLPPAYGPYRWIRYHGDALLVDLRTGRVIDVVYDIFY